MTKLLIGLLFGIGFGYLVQRAALCFAVGLGEVFMGKGKRITQMFLIIFVVTAIGFYFLGEKPIGQIRGMGFYNLLSGIIFGAGIIMCGGCILGSLRQLGEGNLSYAVVILAMIPGMALVVRVLNPLLEKGYAVQNIVLPNIIPVPSWMIITGAIATALGALFFVSMEKKKK